MADHQQASWTERIMASVKTKSDYYNLCGILQASCDNYLGHVLLTPKNIYK